MELVDRNLAYRSVQPPADARLRARRGDRTPKLAAVFHQPVVTGPKSPLKTIKLDLVYDPDFAALEDEEVISFVEGDVVAGRCGEGIRRVPSPTPGS